jgi:hypothetical protein
MARMVAESYPSEVRSPASACTENALGPSRPPMSEGRAPGLRRRSHHREGTRSRAHHVRTGGTGHLTIRRGWIPVLVPPVLLFGGTLPGERSHRAHALILEGATHTREAYDTNGALR